MAITRTQTNHAEAAGAGLTIAVTLSGVAAASLVVHDVSNDDTTGTIASVKDDLNVAAVVGATVDSAALTQRAEIWYHEGYSGGNRTFTATFSASTAAFRSLVSTEYAGAATSGAKEGSASSTGTSATPTTTNISPTPSVDGMLIVGTMTGASLPTAAAPFLNILQQSTSNNDSEDLVQSVKAAVAATWTMTSGAYGACAVSFKPAASVALGPMIGRSTGPGRHPGRVTELKVQSPRAFEPGPPVLPSFGQYGRSFNPGNHVGRFAMVARRTVLGISIPTGQTFTYDGSGGLQSGGAAPVQVLFIPRPTGGLQSGGQAPLLFIAIPTVGGGLQSGGTAPSSLTKSFVASGGLQSGGHAPRTFTAVPRPTGGLHSAGSAPMSAQLVHRPSGGLNASGAAPKLFILSVRPSGGLNASGAASAVFIPGGQPQQTRTATMWIGMGIRV